MENQEGTGDNAMYRNPPEWIYHALHAIDTDFKNKEQELKRHDTAAILVSYGIIKVNENTTIVPYMIYLPECDAGNGVGASNDPLNSCPFHAMTITKTSSGWRYSGKAPVNSCYPGLDFQSLYAKYDESQHEVYVKLLNKGKEFKDCSNSIHTTN